MDHTEQPPVIISLCTGIRGIERGIERALGIPVRTAAFVERETFIVENLLAAMEYGLVVPAPIWANLKTFPFASFHGKVHGIIGGYPCQPFSLAGHRKGTGDPRHLWPFIREGIRAAEPVWCFFENVDDHLTMGFDEVYRDLVELGYLVESGIYSAEEVGSPHGRQRLYIFAIRREMAHTNGYDPGRIFRHLLRQKGKSVKEEDKRERHRHEPGTRGKAVAHTGGVGIRESGEEQQSKLFIADGLPRGDEILGEPPGLGRQRHVIVQRDAAKATGTEQWRGTGGADKTFAGWPAGQGPYQYEDEPPRTVESRMVYTLNGYGFIGDLHRAIGNGVVEQTAEKAFKDLTRKHLKTMKAYGY